MVLILSPPWRFFVFPFVSIARSLWCCAILAEQNRH